MIDQERKALPIFIGYDPRQPIAFHVAMQSLLDHSSHPLDIRPLHLNTLPLKRQGLTPFTYSRFLVPHLMHFRGVALYLDSDIMFRADVAELFKLMDPSAAVAAVDTNPEFERSSLMLLQCGHYANRALTPDFVESTKIDLHKLAWITDKARVQALPSEWNHLVGYSAVNPTAKAVHFTQGLPCHKETWITEHAEEWRAIATKSGNAASWIDLMGNSVHAKHVLAKREEPSPQQATNDGPQLLIHLPGGPKPMPQPNTQCVLKPGPRHEQVLANLKRGLPEIHAASLNDRECVIVGFGPSLQDTWDDIKAARKRGALIMSVPGSHDFLIERGIVPDYHCQIDPRGEEQQRVKYPNPHVTYLLASACHPTTFDHLRHCRVMIFNHHNGEGDKVVVERAGENHTWIVGGSTVGLTAMSVARLMGYRRLLMHGLDSSYREDKRHAGTHAGKVQQRIEVSINEKPDVRYVTSSQMVSQVYEFYRLLGYYLRDCQVTLFGTGLMQDYLQAITNHEASKGNTLAA